MAYPQEKNEPDVQRKGDTDSEANVLGSETRYALHRELKNRHMAMIRCVPCYNDFSVASSTVVSEASNDSTALG